MHFSYVANNISNPLFSDINGKNLDNEQRRAIVTDELSTLVVAGAGSGKTLTICGKVEYLLKEKNDNLKEQLKHAVENEKEAKKDAKHSRMWVYISTGIAFASLIATIIIAIVK